MFAILFLGLFSAHASDRLSAEITSLNYYPHYQRLEASSRLMTSIHDDTSSSSGTSSRLSYNAATFAADYGFGKRWRLGVSESLAFGQSKQNFSAAGTEVDSSSNGFANPILTLAWRAFDTHHDGLSGDFALTYSPSLGDKTVDDGKEGHTGNNLNGGWIASAYAALFWRWGSNEMEGRATETENGESKTADSTSAMTSATRAYQILSLTFNERLHLTDSIYVQLGATFFPAHATDQTNGNGVGRISETNPYTNSRADFGIRVAPHTLIEASFTNHQTSSLTSSTSGPNVSSQNKQNLLYLSFLHQI